jgi:alpha-amylase
MKRNYCKAYRLFYNCIMSRYPFMTRGLFFAFCLFWSLGFSQNTLQSKVYYEIFIRSFQDSDKDGIGDIQGLIQRLDYLQKLGITGLWLMPVHPSPSYHGYDVTDFYAINPDYGTLDDFKLLLTEAHARGISVIMDLVVNHTSNQHPWFKASQAGDPTYRDYYSWSDTDVGLKGTSGASAWYKSGNGYYLGLFWSGMPDLNYRNPALVEEMKQIAQFWLELGVDGFRVDAIQHIVETEGNIRNTAETFTWLKDFEAFIKTVNPQAFLVGETWTDTQAIVRYHTGANLDMSFNYPLWSALLEAIQKRSATDLAFILKQDETSYPSGALRGTFISNHDQIRPASTLNVRRDVARMKVAAGLLLTLPGVPFIYYGEELGMPNGQGNKDEEKRTPMLWDSSAYAGFSLVKPWYALSTEDFSLSVQEQQKDPQSLLNWYKTLIALRNANPALSQGLTQVVPTKENALLAFKRASADQTFLILANVGNKPLSFEVGEATDLLSGETVAGTLEIAKLGFRVLQF